MSPPLEFITTLRPNRPDFLATMTPKEKTVLGQHMAYTRQLFDQGKIVLGGAATDGAIGIIVWRVDSTEEMLRIYENAPADEGRDQYPELTRSGSGCSPGDRGYLILISNIL